MRTIVRAAVLSLVFTFAGCGGPKNAWTSLSPATPSTYAAGTAVVDTSAVIDAAGGTLTGPTGTPVAGVVVTVPPGAVAVPTTFTLGHDEGGSFTNVDAAERSGLVIVLDTDGQHEFAQLLTVEFPFTDPVKIPVPYYLRPDGSFELVRPLPVDRDAGRGGFYTRHASNYSWVNKDPHSLNQPVWNGFSPALDGVVFSNTVVDKEYAPIGRCWGISAFAKWYKETQGGGLAGQFTTPVLTTTSRKTSLTGQEVLATRAHISVARISPGTSGMSQTQAVVSVLDALARGAVAVMVGLADPAGHAHAVLAIGFSDNQIALYDSNHPQEWKALDYEFDGTDYAIATYGDYDTFAVWSVSSMPQTEKFETILRDAEVRFNEENQTRIEITSHQNNATVRDADITLEGKVHSGQVSISRLEINFLKPDGTWSEIQVVELEPGQEDFSLALHTLGLGNNEFVFLTKGYVTTGDEPATIPNDGATQGEASYSLTLDPGATSNVTVTGSSITIVGPANDPDSRREVTANYSANFSFDSYPTTVQAIQAETFPFDACAASTSCLVVQGRTTTSMDPEDQNNFLPISVVYDSQTWSKTANGFELTEKCHGDGPLTWVSLRLKIAVEPGCGQTNRQYRLVATPGCEVVSLCPPVVEQPTLSCQCLDPDTGTWHGCGTSDPMTIPPFMSLEQIDNNNLDTITPPRIGPATLEDFILNGKTPQAFGFQGVVDDTADPNYSHTENAFVTLTLAP
jgi:hypothetical protein